MQQPTNKQLYELSKQHIPGGVNSPVRSFNAVEGIPFFTKRAYECYLIDVEQRQYIDYVCSWGTNIVSHAHPDVIHAMSKAIDNGVSYGTPTALELKLVTTIKTLMPNIEKLRLVNSGTEAVMTAIRLARGYTQKQYIIKFNGCYHGHVDSLLVKAGSGLATYNHMDSSGIIDDYIKYTLVAEYNNIQQVEQFFKTYVNNIAAIIVEPIAGNMNLVLPQPKFLAHLRELCNTYNSVLIFDEVMTGFRVGIGGAQQLFNVQPDLTTLGKIIGGGMPLAAIGGRSSIMDYLAPLGSVYQAGTLSGNPVAVSCGLATLELIQAEGFYAHINNSSQRLTLGMQQLAQQYKLPFSSVAIGGMFGFYFTHKLPETFHMVQQIQPHLFKQFFHGMLNLGVYFAPSMFEAGFVCYSHKNEIIDLTLAKVEQVFYNIQQNK